MDDLATVLAEFWESRGYSRRKLARLSGLSNSTLNDWLTGTTKHPQEWRKVIMVARALELDHSEANRLLLAAGHPPLDELLEAVGAEDQELLAVWSEEQEATGPPFQVRPISYTEFISRDFELQQARQALLSGSQTCVIHGMSGVGKTTLAIQIAHSVRQEFPDGVLWATLPSYEPDQPIAERLASVLRVFLEAYGHDLSQYGAVDAYGLSQILRSLLARKQVLLILDDIHSSEELKYLRPPTGDCALLVTTRDRAIAAELDVNPINVGPFREREAIQLLQSIAGDERIAEDLQSAMKVISLVDGLPLALNIMARYLKKSTRVTMREFGASLEEQPEFLFQRLDRWAPKGVWQSFELAFKWLPPDLQQFFAALSVFTGESFSVEAAAAVSGQLSPELTRLDLEDLVALSLVEVVQEPSPTGYITRYQLHRLLRFFSREKLGDKERETVYRCIAYYLDYIETRSKFGYAEIDVEWDNISGMLRWARQEKEWQVLTDLVNGLTVIDLGVVGFLDARGYWQTAVTLLETIQSYHTPDDEVSMRYKEGLFALRLSELELAQAHFEKALQLLQDSPVNEEVDLWEARICEAMAQLEMQRNNQEAMTWATRGLAAANRLETEAIAEEKGYLLIRQATILARMGQMAEARETIERGLELLPAGPSAARVSGLMTLGIIYNIQGTPGQARKCWEQGVEAAEAIGDHRRLATLWRNLSILAEETGDLNACLRYNQRALRRYEDINDQAGAGHVASNMGFVYLLLRDMDAADTYLQQAADIAATHKMPDLALFAGVNRARWHIYRGEMAEASAHLDKSMVINQELRLSHTQAELFRLQAMTASHGEQYEEAVDLIDKSLRLAADDRHDIEVGRSWRVKGAILGGMGDSEGAVEAFTQSLEMFGERNLFELARTEVTLAEHYFEQGNEPDSRPLLESAHVIFAEREAEYWVAVVNSLLIQLSAW